MGEFIFDEELLEDDDFSFSDMDQEDYLYLSHVGTPHEGMTPHSGRYAWGSGEHGMQRAYDFYNRYNKLRKIDKKSEREIAEELGVVDRYGNPNVDILRARYSNAGNEIRAYERAYANYLYFGECNGNKSEVARRMGKNESTIRSYLNEERTKRANLTQETAEQLKAYVDKNRYVDVSEGTNLYLGVTKSRLDNAVAYLEEQGYKKQKVKVDQLGTNHKLTFEVLTAPDVDYAELNENRFDIRFPGQDPRMIDESGNVLKYGALEKPPAVSSDRIAVNFKEEGGLEEDGTIYLRPGVPDLYLGGATYAQVRINVDDTHYLKGMARYSNDIPEGFDILVNSNKKIGTPLKAENPDDPGAKQVFKSLQKLGDSGEVDWSNPFGAGALNQVKSNGILSACQIVRSEDDWQKWNRNLPSQFLSKQPVALAERQLKLAADDRKREFEEIMALDNSEVRKKFLIGFADKCDAAAVELKAAPFPGQQTHVILPVPELKDNECYAPNLSDGTRVALVRFPHQGKFEIPELTVRNTGSPAKEKLGNIPDAIGINHNVADRLSGADFDGDTVLVIPLSDKVRIQTQPQLEGLKNFDAKERYPYYKGMKVMTERDKELQMGIVSNLITDMTMQGAPAEHLERATRHALVVIDAEKHKLDWKASERIEKIDELKAIYQQGGGASTIISKAKSEERVNERREWYPSKNSIGPNGEKIYTETGEVSLRGKLKGIPMNNGKIVTVKEEKVGGQKTGKLYYTEADPETGKNVRHYVSRGDFPDDIETLKKGRDVYLNQDPQSKKYYYLQTDPSTKKKVRAYIDPDKDLVSGIHESKRQQISTKMAETQDAFTLTRGGSKDRIVYPMEEKYANYANEMKALANKARRAYIDSEPYIRDPGAAKKYAAEVTSLKQKVTAIKMNAPIERQAQLLANRHVALVKEANPNLSDEQIGKIQARMITAARDVLKSQKAKKFVLSPEEVEAIRAHAITATTLRAVLDKCDQDDLKKNFTPRSQKTLTPGMESLAKSMYASGYTYAQISQRLGISPTSANRIIKGKE